MASVPRDYWAKRSFPDSSFCAGFQLSHRERNKSTYEWKNTQQSIQRQNPRGSGVQYIQQTRRVIVRGCDSAFSWMKGMCSLSVIVIAAPDSPHYLNIKHNAKHKQFTPVLLGSWETRVILVTESNCDSVETSEINCCFVLTWTVTTRPIVLSPSSVSPRPRRRKCQSLILCVFLWI